MKGTTGARILPTAMRYDLWLRLGSIRLSNSVNAFLALDGTLSHVWDNRLMATLDSPITIAQKAFKFWYSLQLKLKFRTLV